MTNNTGTVYGTESGDEYPGPEDRPRRDHDALAGLRHPRQGPSFAQRAQTQREGTKPRPKTG